MADKSSYEGEFRRIYDLFDDLFEKMEVHTDRLNSAATTAAVGFERYNNEINSLKKAVGEIAGNVKELHDWKLKLVGSFRVLLVLPTVCILVTTGVAIWGLVK